jgi:8-oxo-dGTP pyrophosphatase MutT (NUDIX family)
VDEGETAESAAIRECQEESGLLCQALKPLVTFHPGLDVTYNPTYVFHTDQFVETHRQNRDAREACQPVWVPLPRCVDMIFGQEIADSLSIVSILSYRTLMGRA